MKLNEIQDLIKFVAKSGVSEVELETKDVKITIKTNGKGEKSSAPMVVQQSIPMVQSQISQPVFQPVAQPVAETRSAEQKKEASAATDESKLVTIKSPMIGTFYRAPAPDADSYVEAGQTVQSGTVLCIIEAMKLMNEIESDVSGRVVKILVENAQPVEYNQTLFLIEPM